MDFYSLLSAYYDAIFPFHQARFSYLHQLCLQEGFQRILDLGCGTGTDVLEFCKRGYEAVGVDGDPLMLEIAQGKAQREGLSPLFLVGDLQDLEVLSLDPFQLITCTGNTLAHLTNWQDLSQALSQMVRLLLPGGVLLVQLVNYDRVLQEGLTQLPTISGEGFSFQRRYSLRQDGLISFQGTLSTPQGESKRSIPLRPIGKKELQGLMEEAGLSQLHFYHDFQSTPFTQAEGAPLGLVGVGKRVP